MLPNVIRIAYLFVLASKAHRDIGTGSVKSFEELQVALERYFLLSKPNMSSDDIAEEIRMCFPGAEEVIVQYLAGYLVDDAGEEEDVLQVAHYILASLAGDRQDILQKLMLRLGVLMEERLNSRAKNRSGPKLMKLDKVLDMSKSQISSTIALSEGVDLESINKGKCVRYPCNCRNSLIIHGL